jgi:MFS family permease
MSISVREPVESSAQQFTEAPYPRPVYAWYVVGVLTLAYISSFIDRQILALLVGPIRRDLQITDTQMSLLMGLSFALFYTVLGLPIGRLADARSRRGIIAAGIALWSAMTALCGVARNYAQLLLARIGVGVGEAALSPPAYSLIADYFPRRRLATALSIYSMGIYIGSGLALLLGGAILGAVSTEGTRQVPLVGRVYPWQTVFFFVGLPGLIIALLMFTVREVPRRNLLHSGKAGVPFRDVAHFIGKNWRVYVPHNVGFALWVLMGQGTAAWAPTLFIRTYGWTPAETGTRYGILVIVLGVLGIISGGRLADRLLRLGYTDAKMRVCLFAALGIALFTAIYPLMPSGGLAMLLFMPVMFFTAFPMGAAAAAIQELTPSDMRAQASSLYLFVANILGLGLGPTAVALVTDYGFGSDNALRYSLVIVCTIAVLGAAALFRSSLAPYRRMVEAARSS